MGGEREYTRRGDQSREWRENIPAAKSRSRLCLCPPRSPPPPPPLPPARPSRRKARRVSIGG
eukprot:562624-Prorocentrum_minimum.AAC.1